MRLVARIIVLCLLLAGSGAEACRIRRPPVIPIIWEYDAVAFATVARHEDNGAEARVSEMIVGRADRRTVRLQFGIQQRFGNIVVTSCGPAGPAVRTGDRIVIVFGRSDGRQYVAGWVTRAFAEENDDFFALYGREQDPAERRRLRRHWIEVNRHRGPVPRSDPAHWMSPHAGALEWTTEQNATDVQFDINAQGGVANCRFWHAERPAARDATICQRLRGRRFEPPLFERERHGMFEVRWRDSQ